MRGIYSLGAGVPDRETVPQVVIVLDSDVSSWLAGWIGAHLEGVQYALEEYPRVLADVLNYAVPYDHG